jgi:hypothetical protein
MLGAGQREGRTSGQTDFPQTALDGDSSWKIEFPGPGGIGPSHSQKLFGVVEAEPGAQAPRGRTENPPGHCRMHLAQPAVLKGHRFFFGMCAGGTATTSSGPARQQQAWEKAVQFRLPVGFFIRRNGG